MSQKRHTLDQVIAQLRRGCVLLGKGAKVPDVCKQTGITEQTDYRWRQKYGGMQPAIARQLKALEKENARLKKMVAQQTLDMEILKLPVLWVKQNVSCCGLGCNASCSRCRFSGSKYSHVERPRVEMLSPAGRRRLSTQPSVPSAVPSPAPPGGQDRAGESLFRAAGSSLSMTADATASSRSPSSTQELHSRQLYFRRLAGVCPYIGRFVPQLHRSIQENRYFADAYGGWHSALFSRLRCTPSYNSRLKMGGQ